MAGLVGGGAFVAHRLDAWLTERIRAEANALGAKLGRPVRIGRVATTWLSGVGMRVDNFELGGSVEEGVPVLTVPSSAVKVAWRPLVQSRGADVRVEHIRIQAPVLNVVRFADGKTNLEKLSEKLSQLEGDAPNGSAESKADDSAMSRFQVAHAAIVDGAIRFTDSRRQQLGVPTVSDIDVEVNDFRVGKALEIVVRAALLGGAQNLQMKWKSAPLPPTLVPSLRELVLKLSPIDLASLAPLLPSSVGLQAGRLQADIEAKLGSLVSGGEGPVFAVGNVRAEGLKFASTEGGRPLDATLKLDVDAEPDKGTARFRVFELNAGPTRLSGRGELLGLLTDTPEAKQFVLEGTGVDLAALSAYYPPLAKTLAGRWKGPMTFRIHGGGDAAGQALVLEANLTPVRLVLPEQLKKEAGAPMTLAGNVRLSPRLLRFDGRVDVSGADFRPGGVMNKPAGQPMVLSGAGTFRPKSSTLAQRVDLSRFDVRVAGQAVSGQGFVESRNERTDFAVDLKSDRLDADTLLLSPENKPAEVSSSAKGGGGVPSRPNPYAGLHGDMNVAIGALRYDGYDWQDVRAQIRLDERVMSVKKFSSRMQGGTVTADGTRIELEENRKPFQATVKVKDIDIGALLPDAVPKGLLTGKFSGDIAVSATDIKTAALGESLQGLVNGQISGGKFKGADLVAGVVGPLASALHLKGTGVSGDGTTSLGEVLPLGVKFANGQALLSRPMTLTRPEANILLDGGLKLTGELALKGQVALSPQTVERLTQGRVRLSEALPIGLAVGGMAWKPVISGIDISGAVRTLTKHAAANAIGSLLGGKVKGGAQAGAADVAAAAVSGDIAALEAKAAEERAQREAQLKQEAEAAKRRLQEEAKKRLKGLFGR
ncbi:MAG: AsmA family protein [Myxococcaceae bacterium]